MGRRNRRSTTGDQGLAGGDGRRRERGAGGITPVRAGVWRVDTEVPRQPGERRRRISQTVYGSRTEAEQAVLNLRAGATEESEALSIRLPHSLAAALAAAAALDDVSIAEEARIAIADRLRLLGVEP
jgi:hypothetical protein